MDVFERFVLSLTFQVDQNLRRTWDTYAGQMATVDSDELSNCKLIHWIMKYPVGRANTGGIL